MLMGRLILFLFLQTWVSVVNASKLCFLDFSVPILDNNDPHRELTVSRIALDEMVTIEVSAKMRCALLCGKTCIFFAHDDNYCRLYKNYFEIMVSPSPYFIEYGRYKATPCKTGSFALLVFRHDSKDQTFWPRDVTSLNVDEPTALRYAILDEIDDWRAQDGSFHFKLCYPDLSGSPCYRWSQSDNPLKTSGTPRDFVYMGPNSKPYGFVGLSQSTPELSLLDGNAYQFYFFAIGSYLSHTSPNTFPGPYEIVNLVELFLEI